MSNYSAQDICPDGKNKKKAEIKYRYFMNGMFSATDGSHYEINIPSPNLYNTEEEAMADGRFGYRFVLLDKTAGPEVVIFEREDFKLSNDKNGKQCLDTWVDGKVIATYTFEQFKKVNGYIRMLKPECQGSGFIDGDTDFVSTEKSFEEIFPNIQPQKLYYIDNMAYSVEKVEAGNE